MAVKAFSTWPPSNSSPFCSDHCFVIYFEYIYSNWNIWHLPTDQQSFLTLLCHTILVIGPNKNNVINIESFSIMFDERI